MDCKRRRAPFFGRWTEANPLCTGFWQVKQPRAILGPKSGRSEWAAPFSWKGGMIFGYHNFVTAPCGRRRNELLRRIRDCLDYGKDPEKTESGKYISAYECDPATVADEFLLAKASYAAMTGREQKKENNVLCYQIRQSFYPGEITPKEANRIGYELAMRWTKGRHAFIVTTHTDKQHIHCHIYYNSTTLDCTRKFRNLGLQLRPSAAL